MLYHPSVGSPFIISYFRNQTNTFLANTLLTAENCVNGQYLKELGFGLLFINV